MDNPVHNSPESLNWSTPPAALVATGIGGLVLLGAAVVAPDPPARLLVGLAAALLLGMTAVALRLRPRLTARLDPPRLVVGGLRRPAEYSPAQVMRARVLSPRRHGRSVPSLEIDIEADGHERLLIFGRWDLGAHPQDVLDALIVHGVVPHEDAGR
ncbi:PH domain-containing protein [Nocardia stercoris]|uniref:PH domain-containing protein n=1 Tax=Nocardia stercoris TaxID=2483361 RepID=A0A3M2LH86_9NOCA|nr:PH domain-containing protein [Nocardia stercoris]RMI34118.1 PH domain-containing protein [Nocardia stercoris]